MAGLDENYNEKRTRSMSKRFEVSVMEGRLTLVDSKETLGFG